MRKKARSLHTPRITGHISGDMTILFNPTFNERQQKYFKRKFGCEVVSGDGRTVLGAKITSSQICSAVRQYIILHGAWEK